ncbi:MAG: hypothetical protein AABY22_33135, partial [Nanoarchaeota archaeon]
QVALQNEEALHDIDEKITGIYGIQFNEEGHIETEMFEDDMDNNDLPNIPLEKADQDWLKEKLKHAENKDDYEEANRIVMELEKRFNYKRPS